MLKFLTNFPALKVGRIKFFTTRKFLGKLALSIIKPNYRQDLQAYYRIYKFLFDEDWYRRKYGSQFSGDPFYHFLTDGWRSGSQPNPLFDVQWYLDQNPDVQEAGTNPLEHYALVGWKEGRLPHILFDPRWYLAQNSDVQSAGIEPLTHYLTAGYRENRPPTFWFDEFDYLDNFPELRGTMHNPFVHFVENCPDVIAYFNQEVRGEQLNNLLAQRLGDEELFESSYIQRSPRAVMGQDELIRAISSRLSQKTNYIAISHDNYLEVTGGVQNCLADQQTAFNADGIGFLHFFPFNSWPTILDAYQEFFVGINCNGQFLGVSRSDVVIKCLSRLKKDHKFQKLILHHTMGIELKWIKRIQKVLSTSEQVYFWLHDYFSICPSYNLLRNNIEFCNAPEITSNACSICIYGNYRKKQTQAFDQFFGEVQPVIISPSNFTLDYWKEKTDFPARSTIVQPHGGLIPFQKTIQRRATKSPLRVAFLGYPVHHKGWEVYVQLVSKFFDDTRYSFYHFGKKDADIDLPLEFISVSVTPENRTAMVDAIIDHEIDIVVLWAIWPETYSFTLFEALSAGCYIISNRISGNIQAVVREQNCGRIFEDKESLFEAFRSGEVFQAVQEYFVDGKTLVPYKLRTSFEG